MIDFWFLIALLALAALVFVWWPILSSITLRRRQQQADSISRQDLNIQAFESQAADLHAELEAGRLEQVQYDALKTELERNLLGDVSVQQADEQPVKSPQGAGLIAIVLSLTVLVGGLGLYLNLGSSDTLQQMNAKQNFAQQLTTATPEQRLLLLEAESRHNPQDGDTWYALANVYFQYERFDEAIAAYERLLSLVGDQPGLLAEYAQVMFFIQGNRVTVEVKNLAERTLRVQPGNMSALGLLGIDAFESKRYTQAIAAWETALEVAPDAQGAEALRQGIMRAQQLLAELPEQEQEEQAQSDSQEPAARLTLQISIDNGLLAQLSSETNHDVSPDATVFVLARTVNGPPMPLAVQRLQVKDLPAEVILSDAMAMTPELKLSSVSEVEVVARISFSGQPLPQKGDLQGSFGPVNVSDKQAPITLVIDQIIR